MSWRILLVDDEVAFLMPMKKMLYGPRVHVDTAETLDEAMQLLEQERYDAVVADIRLGGALSREGLKILEHVKTHLPTTKVLIMTGYGSTDTVRDAVRLGADRYMEKPVSYRLLSEALTELGVAASEFTIH